MTFADYFELLALPRQFAIDVQQLETNWHKLQASFHPDRFATAPAREKYLAMEHSACINDAWKTLREPQSRARYLLELTGVSISKENQQALLSPDFLMSQMALREEVEAAADSKPRLQALLTEVQSERAQQVEKLRLLIDEHADYKAASTTLAEIMFQDKLVHLVEDQLEALAWPSSDSALP